MSSAVRDNSGCASVTESNATSCDSGDMTFTIDGLSAGTNYTASVSVQNLGGQGDESSVTVVTQSQPHGELFFIIVMKMMMNVPCRSGLLSSVRVALCLTDFCIQSNR